MGTIPTRWDTERSQERGSEACWGGIVAESSLMMRVVGVVAVAHCVACSAADDQRPSGNGPADDTGDDDADGDGGVTDGAGTGGETAADETEGSQDETGGPLTALLAMHLVGRSVAGSPHFVPVDNFNDGDTITLGIDASRVGIAGDCDAYVINDRDADTWASDPTLTDVRASGATTVSLSGGLPDNRFELAVASELSSDAGTGLGVAYDVVLDCDGDGELGPGDVIDGLDGAGLYRTHDATQPGPLAVSMLAYTGGTFLGQRTFYPTDVASLGQLPLVVVTHGWSYTYEHYDYIGQHLASYGYVVMHHETNVQDGGPPGTFSAASDTLDNTHYLLDNLATIGDGALDGHIDASRIMLTGHSTGGEAVVRAVTELRTGEFSSPHFGYDDIKIVSSMAPVSWQSRQDVDPGDVAYHLFVAGADDDVSGAPIDSYTQSRSIYERAQGDRQLTTIHGAGHGDLVSCCGPLFLDTSAPDLIGREATNQVARSVFLGLAELYLRSNEAAREYFTRPYPDYHAPGIPNEVVVTREYRGASAGVVLDDFETSPGGDDALVRSSAGTDVEVTVSNAVEVLMRDNDGSFVWTGDQPANGMTHARHEGDDPHALVFDFAEGQSAHYQVALPEAATDLRDFAFVSLRACQGTRHPLTTALGGSLIFTVVLTDQAGAEAAVILDGARSIPPPYARGGEGPGVGWGNEFVTVRVGITEFLGDNPSLDLSAVDSISLQFGSASGSSQGRVGLDDIELIAGG